MKTHSAWPLVSVSVEREEIPVGRMSPARVPDDKWRYVDKKGHGHFWKVKELPTLEWVVTGTEWVGDEYGGDEYEVGEYRCKFCSEVVEPGKKLEHGPSHIPGPTWITIDVNGERFIVDPDQYAESVDAWTKALRKVAR